MMLKCSGCGAGALFSQSAPPPSVGADAECPRHRQIARRYPPPVRYPTG
jgi:hypothetical protein